MTGQVQIAALFVELRGIYAGLPGVDLWDIARDARTYAGPYPVVAHPPCARFCRLAGLVAYRYPHRPKHQDDGCFASALRSVRTYGGVLEHPAYSDAFGLYGLRAPRPKAGWTPNHDGHDGWVCHVEQARYGHAARKATWLYACRTDRTALNWDGTLDYPGRTKAYVSSCDMPHYRPVRRLSKKQRNATPRAFRDALVALARSVPQLCHN